MEERIAAHPARSFLRATRDPEGGPPAGPSYCRPAGDVQLERQAGQASCSGDRLKPVTGRVVSDRGAGDAADRVEVDSPFAHSTHLGSMSNAAFSAVIASFAG